MSLEPPIPHYLERLVASVLCVYGASQDGCETQYRTVANECLLRHFTARGKPDLSTTHEFTILKNALDSSVLAYAVQATQPYGSFDDFKRKMILYFARLGSGNDFGGVARKLIARTAEYQFKGSPFSASELIALQEVENYYRQNGSTLGMP